MITMLQIYLFKAISKILYSCQLHKYSRFNLNQNIQISVQQQINSALNRTSKYQSRRFFKFVEHPTNMNIKVHTMRLVICN